MDLNGDGKISYEEFKAMMQGIRQGTTRYKALQGARAESKDAGSRASTPRNSFDDSRSRAALALPVAAPRNSRSGSVDRGSKKKA